MVRPEFCRSSNDVGLYERFLCDAQLYGRIDYRCAPMRIVSQASGNHLGLSRFSSWLLAYRPGNIHIHDICVRQGEELKIPHADCSGNPVGSSCTIDLSSAISVEDSTLRHKLLQASFDCPCISAYHSYNHSSSSCTYRHSSFTKEICWYSCRIVYRRSYGMLLQLSERYCGTCCL